MRKLFFVFIFFIILNPLPASAAESFMFLSSGSGVFSSSKDFTARLAINSGQEKGINAAEAVLKFDPKAVKVKAISTDKSIFELWTVKPVFSNTEGTITFGGGLPKAFKETAGVIFNITFIPQKRGKTLLDFASSTSILSADGSGKNIIKEAWQARLTFDTATAVSQARAMTAKFSGRILLQVERNGEAWYIYPVDNRRYYLGRPLDAFNLMRKLSLGVTHKYIASYTTFPKAVAGKILLDVEDSGKAYYIYPIDRKAYYLGRPDDAFKVMRELGLGITNDNIDKIIDWAI